MPTAGNQPVRVRLDDDRRTWVDEEATKLGLTAAEFVRHLIDRARAGDVPTAAGAPPKKVRGVKKVSSGPATACEHPKEMLKKLGWGTICGVCNSRIR